MRPCPAEAAGTLQVSDGGEGGAGEEGSDGGSAADVQPAVTSSAGAGSAGSAGGAQGQRLAGNASAASSACGGYSAVPPPDWQGANARGRGSAWRGPAQRPSRCVSCIVRCLLGPGKRVRKGAVDGAGSGGDRAVCVWCEVFAVGRGVARRPRCPLLWRFLESLDPRNRCARGCCVGTQLRAAAPAGCCLPACRWRPRLPSPHASTDALPDSLPWALACARPAGRCA